MDQYATNRKLLTELLPEGQDYIRIDNEPFLPLVAERVGENQISLCHYGVQEGDLMRDPEVVFLIEHEGNHPTAKPVYFRQDYVAVEHATVPDMFGDVPVKPHLQKDLDSFVRTWTKNIREQGFVEAAEELHHAKDQRETAEAQHPTGPEVVPSKERSEPAQAQPELKSYVVQVSETWTFTDKVRVEASSPEEAEYEAHGQESIDWSAGHQVDRDTVALTENGQPLSKEQQDHTSQAFIKDRVNVFGKAIWAGYTDPHPFEDLQQERVSQLTGLLSDVLHWSHTQGISFDNCLEQAITNHEKEQLRAEGHETPGLEPTGVESTPMNHPPDGPAFGLEHREALGAVLDYLWDDERSDCEANPSRDHIFTRLALLRELCDPEYNREGTEAEAKHEQPPETLPARKSENEVCSLDLGRFSSQISAGHEAGTSSYTARILCDNNPAWSENTVLAPKDFHDLQEIAGATESLLERFREHGHQVVLKDQKLAADLRLEVQSVPPEHDEEQLHIRGR